jgi:hypothetical protein
MRVFVLMCLKNVEVCKDKLQNFVRQYERLESNIAGFERQLNEEICRIEHHIDTSDQTGDKAQAAIDRYQVNWFCDFTVSIC